MNNPDKELNRIHKRLVDFTGMYPPHTLLGEMARDAVLAIEQWQHRHEQASAALERERMKVIASEQDLQATQQKLRDVHFRLQVIAKFANLEEPCSPVI